MAKNRVDKAWVSMRENLEKNTGKSLEQWIQIIDQQPFTRTSEKVDFLKKTHGLGYGYAGMIVYEAKLAKDGSIADPEELVRKQYLGKEDLVPIYEKLLKMVKSLGQDVEIAPKNSYVSIRRDTQFAMLSPATKNRFEIMLKLKGVVPEGVLESLPKPSMCTHRIKLSTVEEINEEIFKWLKEAYHQAGKGD